MTDYYVYDPTLVLAIWGVLLVAGIAGYVWYALMLSRVFARLGAESWKAWVPILNEAEILRLGGVPAWSVVFYYLPIVQFYGLYLKAVATSRINAHFGHGVGSTVLAVLLPPVWATLLAAGPRATDPALQERIAPSVAERSGYAFAVTTPPPAAEPPAPVPPTSGVPPLAPGVPLPPPGAAAPPPLVTPPAPPAPPAAPPAQAFPPPPAPPAAPPAAPVAPPAPPASAPPFAAPPPAAAPPPPAAPAAAPPPAPPADLLPPPPAAPGAPAAPGPIVPPPGLITPPPTITPPPVAPTLPAQPWAPLDRPVVAPEPPGVAPVLDPGAEGDELDRTVVVDRRPVVPWVLIVDGGPTLRLTGTRVVLGRRPAGAGEGAQELAVPDPTRTLSKVHARLDLADGAWTVTDLNATNGVIVIGPDGAEDLLDPGASAPVAERFVLGKVGMRIAVAEDDAGR